MSAIWGTIDFNNEYIPESKKQEIKNGYTHSVLDKINEFSANNIYMACGLQFFTPEAKYEVLPIGEGQLLFTGDIVLDNRDQLIRKLKDVDIFPESADISLLPDGTILFDYYKAFGIDGLKDVLGSFALAVYNAGTNALTLICDQTGSRSLHYRICGKKVYFSTIAKPLTKVDEPCKLNDKWISDYLAMDYLFMVNECENTPYQGIYRVAPATAVTITCKSSGLQTSKKTYWDPTVNIKSLDLSSDKEYSDAFNEVWKKAVCSQVRSEDEISILLSAGYDSTAVAAVLAPYLRENNRMLHAYTAVPASDFAPDTNAEGLFNESEEVKKTADFYGNIDCTFVDLAGRDSWDILKDNIDEYDLPVKSIQNSQWIIDSMRLAYQRGSRIIFTGSYGNTSISYSNFGLYMNHLYKTDRKRQKEECKAFSKVFGYPPSYANRKIKQDTTDTFVEDALPFRFSYVKRDIAKKQNCADSINAINKTAFECSRDAKLEWKNRILWISLRQIGDAETMYSLMTGVLRRDPTRDVRVLEYCISIPIDQYCKNGEYRRLVSVYLKDIMPEHILKLDQKGVQSGDLAFRFCKNWDNTKKEWLTIVSCITKSKYVDLALLRHSIENMKDISKFSSYDLVRIMYTIEILKLEYPDLLTMAKNYDLTSKQTAKKEPLISVIIPVYNTSTYLEKAVTSVLNQTYSKIEIILVDDGSTDDSGKICDRLEALHDNVRTIHKTNGGVAAARNTGINAANGDYIAFLDSDDWIEPDMYKVLMELLIDTKSDICGCLYMQDLADGQVIDFSTDHINSLYGSEMATTMISNANGLFINPHVGTKLYKKELFNEDTFADLRKFEDMELLLRLMTKCDKLTLISTAYYHYVKHDNTLTSNNKKRLDDVTDFIKSTRLTFDSLNGKVNKKALRKKYEIYAFILMDVFCNLEDCEGKKKAKRLIYDELKRIRPQALEAIEYYDFNKRSDSILVELGLKNIYIYPYLNKCVNILGKIKRGIRKRL